MAITYSTAVKNTRLDAVTTAIGTAGVIEIGTTGMASVLASITLANPAAAAAASGVLTLTMPRSDTSANATGTAAEARITDGTSTIISGLTVGTTGTDVVLDSISITSGQTVTLNSAVITHG